MTGKEGLLAYLCGRPPCWLCLVRLTSVSQTSACHRVGLEASLLLAACYDMLNETAVKTCSSWKLSRILLFVMLVLLLALCMPFFVQVKAARAFGPWTREGDLLEVHEQAQGLGLSVSAHSGPIPVTSQNRCPKVLLHVLAPTPESAVLRIGFQSTCTSCLCGKPRSRA